MLCQARLTFKNYKMSFTIIDLENPASEFTASVWNWTTAVEVIRSLDVVDDFTTREMLRTASGVKVEEEHARAIGEKIKSELLPKLAPNKRIFSNLQITDSPDDGTFYGHGDEYWKNYSASHRWLEGFAEFCISTKGFQVF